MNNVKIILIEGLRKHYPTGRGGLKALNGIDLCIGRGEFSGIIEPSVSGKTTLLNIIGTLDDPSEEKAIILGKPVKNLSPKESADPGETQLGFIFLTYNLLLVYAVSENVMFPLLIQCVESGKRHRMVFDALEWVGLTDKVKSRPSGLSGGECQRAAIARAMVKRPYVALADEPTANLDAANSHNILKTMEKINHELKTTFIFATHDEKVIGYVMRKIFLHDGKVIKDEQISGN